MDYGLAGLVGRDDVFAPITVDEFLTLKNARSSLFECLSIEEKYDVLIENYLEFETTVLDFAARSMVLGSGAWDYDSFHLARATLDRRLANLLSGCRIYEDHVKQHVHRALPGEQPNLKGLFAEEYDRRLGYRCMEALRNHVQHSGLPVHEVKANRGWTSLDETGMLRFGLTPYVEARFLRENPKFNKKVLQEIEGLGGKVDLKGLVRDYIEGLSVVHSRIRELLREKSREWESVLDGAIRRLGDECQGTTEVWLIRAISLTDGQQAEEFQVFTDFNDRRKYLQKKNEAPLTNLSRRFATSEMLTKE